MPKETKPSRPSLVPVRGRVVAVNVSPKGHAEGALVETAKGIVQLNYPKDGPGAFASAMTVGASVDVSAEEEKGPERDKAAHPVYRLRDEETSVTGAVVRLNYALHGEVNGCHLDDGTFVHLKPDGAKRHALHVGDRIRATGRRKAGADAVVLEATEVSASA